MRKQVAIGFLGTVLDKGGFGEARWKKWRPSVGICRQPQWPLHRLHLLHDNHSLQLAQLTADDIRRVSPDTEVVLETCNLRDPWDFEEVYAALHDFAAAYPFDSEHEDYLLHITTGTHVAQICWFLLAESRHIPARLLQSSIGRADDGYAGTVKVIDLDLSRYDQIAQRFARQRDDTLALLKSGIATRNEAFNRMIGQIERVATRSGAPVLLCGPTGAVQAREGLLKRADGGMLFLDEIGELGLDEQAMLLKAIEEKRFFPYGSDREVSSSFQLVCGTVRDLQQWVAAGRFREDLY